MRRRERLDVPQSSTSSDGSSTSDNSAHGFEAALSCPEVADNVASAVEEVTLRDEMKLLQEQLEQAKKELAECRAALEKALAQQDMFGYDYASKNDKVFKFYTGLHGQDFNAFWR